ncbi:hypothetical protein [Leptospira andrefontaineae]|uniref:Uncharacterized protein n=1 Tax=Leptospira andrefontaineae TaxID=2484976 RepID=A0A4R9H6H5_9LEPT|nr:hypothetical protein [Leptospira andrefontaineae]TGK41168.1 hypothetical protein EHO65_06975 [Leptospira andrefontaineae]
MNNKLAIALLIFFISFSINSWPKVNLSNTTDNPKWDLAGQPCTVLVFDFLKKKFEIIDGCSDVVILISGSFKTIKEEVFLTEMELIQNQDLDVKTKFIYEHLNDKKCRIYQIDKIYNMYCGKIVFKNRKAFLD